MKPLDELLAPIAGDAPTGPDMDESAEFDRLRTAFDINFPLDAKVIEPDDGVPAPAPVDWEELRDEIEALSDQTKDLFLAVSYARCGLVLGDLDTVERGLMFSAGLLESYWEAVNPPIDGVMGYPGRAGIFENLAQRGAFGIPFLQMAIVRDGRMALTGEQLRDAAENEGASDHFATARRVLDSLDEAHKQALAARFVALLDALARIERAMKEHADGASAPDFSTTRDIIQAVQDAYLSLAGLAQQTGGGEVADVAGDGVDAGMVSGDPAVANGAGFSGKVRSREDVLRALTEIEQYYARFEPGHPVKVASARLRGWVTKDFMAILEDIVPNSVDDAKNVLLERRNVE
ncbi:ImpA family type VI secretion system protein [Tsuneonella sp. SYSU-LHT278]|uniref:type VI secretion system protein TssA n=1 Tax=Tsuneonella sediminis TaxID=3416089 RepID=UPI003F79D71D